jgi:peptidoglycan/LPS O-acetylase OafA/YrhL
MAEGGRLRGLQSLRALAALSVLLQHVTYYSCGAFGVDYQRCLPLRFGEIGVRLFFVISGFVMAGCMTQGRLFICQRALRIYPTYWLAIAVTFVLFSGTSFGWYFDFRSALLIPSTEMNESYRLPYWTLIFEAAFYLTTYAMILLGMKRRGTAASCALWFAGIVGAAAFANFVPSKPGVWVLLSPWSVFFVAGLLLGTFRHEASRLPLTMLSCTAAAAWLLDYRFGGAAPLISELLSAYGFAGLIIIAIHFGRAPLLERIGDYSYGLYLMHVPVATVIIYALRSRFPDISLLSVWLVTMAAAFGGALLFGITDFRLHRRLKWRFFDAK